MAGGPNIIGDSSYRRGVVLGLTIGEAVLLLLFSLLLVLALPLVQALEENKALKHNLDDFRRERLALVNERDKLHSKIQELENVADGRKIEDITKEYRHVNEVVQTYKNKANRDEKAAQAFRYIADNTPEKLPPQNDTKQPMDLAKEHVSEIVAFRDIASTLDSVRDEHDEAPDPETYAKQVQDLTAAAKLSDEESAKNLKLIDRLKETKAQLNNANSDLANTKGQLANLRQQIATGGRGVEAVPCWTSSDGKPEYIFDVALTTAGLILRDRKLPHRREQQDQLPIESVVYDAEVLPQKFLAMTQKLFDWSKSHECRFFVRAFDLTLPTEKKVYKQHLRYLGQHFYHYEELDEQLWARAVN